MGIKGIYKEIGPGKRISLTKLAVDTLEQTGRPFRLAIDISIWQFQVQAARGGSNPAIRTLFYRLLRLLGLSIQPIFVFDGPNKPVFKRNKRSGRGDGVATSMAKRMIRLFGFEIHDAPGEAEAECALLQQQGIVDAVLSEDVDTIMFGCKRTLRNWSAEGSKSKTPTHVSMYDTEELRQGDSGLDREGMVLVALMSGGDYLPEGIPGAGVKLACEAARAGFGKRLCQLKRSDTSELNSWREWLVYELRHNESGFFRTRHKALNVPDGFPNLDVLRYYTHPVVSPAATIEQLRNQTWGKSVDVQGLREFVRETFDWNYRIGAIKFIRVLAPCLLVRKLMDRSSQPDQRLGDVSSTQEESELVNSISNRRTHFSTDATSELRISFTPTNIVGYDFQEEPDEVISYGRDGLALNSDDEFEALAEEEAGSAAKTSSKKPFSPTELDLYWIPETIAKLGVPLMVEDWEAAQRGKASKRQKAKAPKPKAKPVGMSTGALDKFVKITKNIPKDTGKGKSIEPPASQVDEPTKPAAPTRTRSLLGAIGAPSQSLPLSAIGSQIPEKTRTSTRSSKQTKSSTTTTTGKKKSSSKSTPAVAAADSSSINPWTIAGSQANVRSSTTTTSNIVTTRKAKAKAPSETIVIPSSSPPASPVARPQSPVRRSHQNQQMGTSNTNTNTNTNTTPPSSPSAAASSPFASSPPRNNNSNKRRSITPPPPPSTVVDHPLPPPTSAGTGGVERENPRSIRAASPTPLSSEKPRRRKLARTESLPAEQTTTMTPRKAAAKTRGFARAQTIAVEVSAFSDEEEEEDSDLELPPLSSLVGRLPVGTSAKAKPATNSTLLLSSSPAREHPSPAKSAGSQHTTITTTITGTTRVSTSTTAAAKTQKTKYKQSTLDRTGNSASSSSSSASGGLRMTKLYVPRKSQPGFFKEVDVTVDEAEVLKAHVAKSGHGAARGRAWRRSDIECIDLTGDD